jgi:eukaryotic-like serine/threonine-protein kinase
MRFRPSLQKKYTGNLKGGGPVNTNLFRIDRYELQELLEQGGRAEVWKAFDTQARRYVAIKFLHANLQADPDYVARFQRETQAIAYLRHPNIVQYFDFSTSPPVGPGNITACIVMDYVDGGTLAGYMRNTSRQGAFPPAADIMRLFIPICEAVDYAHQHGIVHGQLKPSNVLLDKRNTSRNAMGEPVVTDFALAKLYGATTSNTSSWFSTPVYTSPEQLSGSPASTRSDIYSLGIMLYEACAGTPPFLGNNPAAIIMQHLNATPASPALMNPALPAALSGIIMRCIAKDPSARFPDAASLAAALAQAAGQQEQDPTSISPTPRIDSPDYSAASVDMPTMLSAGRFPVQEGSAPAAFTPSSPATSGASYPSLPTTAATPAGGGGLAAAYYMASSPGLVASSQPFAGLQTGSTPASPTYGQSTPGFPTAPYTQPTPQPPAAPPSRKPRRRGLWIALSALLVLVVVASGLGAYFAFFSKSTPPATSTSSILGHAYFASSGLLSSNPGSNQGITDELQVKLDNIPLPQAGMSYYAWLLNDKTQVWNPIYLGALTVNNGTAVLSYTNPQHTNLLAANSRFLITEESAASPPLTPSLNPGAWRYYAEFSQVPDPNNPSHYSLYDHIRHLLASDPKVSAAGLSGGLDIWLYRNTEKILEWAGSARDAQKTGDFAFIRRQLTRIMDYLDGTSYTQLAQDLPGQPVLADPAIAKIGMLTFDAAKQDPPGYLYHIGTKHLHEIALVPQASAQQKALAIQINQEIDVLNTWFETMRTEVLQLFQMTDTQLMGSNARALLDSVATLANTAFVGEINAQGQVTPGVVQIHYAIQSLATFDVRACTASNPCKLV